jgi:uroporphyrinogen-III synthase
MTVGVTADRRGEDQAVLLRRLGVDVIRAPMLQTRRELVDDDLRAATTGLIASPPGYLIANTGFGIRAWWERAGVWGLDGALFDKLADARIAARGPKAAGAIRSLGLAVWWRSPTEQLDSVVDHLVETGVDGARIALQLHGDDRQSATSRLSAAGATVEEIPVYRWAFPGDREPALDLIRRCCAGTVDAVTFTAGPAVRNLVELADSAGLADPLLEALNGPVLAVCIGPVCGAVAREEGIAAPLIPEHWRLGSMVKLVGEALAARRVQG